jgi:hypothetical protein
MQDVIRDDLTLDEVERARRELDRAITAAATIFIRKTGLRINKIDLLGVEADSGIIAYYAEIKVEV